MNEYKPKNNANHDIDIKVTQLTEMVLLLFYQYRNLIYTQQELTKGIVSNLYIFSIILLSIGCLLYMAGVLS